VRLAVEQRMASFSTLEAKAAELRRRRATLTSLDASTVVRFVESFFLLEEVAFGPASEARVEARATLSVLYGNARRTADGMALGEQLAQALSLPRGASAFSEFFRTFAREGDGLHRALVSDVLRAGGPPHALSEALLGHASALAGDHDEDGALTMREAALVAFPEQSAGAWLTLAAGYVRVLDPDRASIALGRSVSAPVGTDRAHDLAERRERLTGLVDRAKTIRAAGTPQTSEARLSLGEDLLAIGLLDRAEPLLVASARELPDDARPIVALAKLRFQRVEAKDLLRVAREVATSLEPARKLAHPSRDLYELAIGLSGLTAFEDVLQGSREPAELVKRATVVVERLHTLNEEQRRLSPRRAAVLAIVLKLAREVIAIGPEFADSLPGLLRKASAEADALADAAADDRDARALALSISAFAAEPNQAFARVIATPKVPDEPWFVATRAEIALDLAQASGDADKLVRVRELVLHELPQGTPRDPRASAVLGDVEALLIASGRGTAVEAAKAYREALAGLPVADHARLYANLAWVSGRLADHGQLIEGLRTAVGKATKAPDRAAALATFGTLALVEGELPAAQQLATQALEAEEDTTLALVVRAIARKRLGLMEEARADAVRAVRNIDKLVAATPRRQWGQRGVSAGASMDVNLGISSLRQVYDLRFSAYQRLWLLHDTFDLAELRALAAMPAPTEAGAKDTKGARDPKPSKRR
jgi:tetratricopeptide (TPR) repeat protein